jgi:putative membrane protein (TIGR04086 family)
MLKNFSIELTGILKAIVYSLVLSILATVLIYYSSLPETLFAPLGNLIMVISIFMGACHVSKAHGSKGLIRGVNMGVVFFILMFMATLAFNSSLISIKSFLFTLLLCVISGALDGILGVGLSDKSI